MRIALAQLNYHVGNFSANTAKIIAAIKEAEQAGAELVVFSELVHQRLSGTRFSGV
jgi:NAD+ synthase (glutamine-hydrolysing)